jgi:outer membrane protein assembly factor BamE
MSDIHSNALRLNLVVLALVGLAGCSSFDGASNRIASVVSPYRLDIVQGNVVTREQVAMLKPACRAQVRDILGTACWSACSMQNGGIMFFSKSRGEQKAGTQGAVFFKRRVERVEADELPANRSLWTPQSPTPTVRHLGFEASEEHSEIPLPTKPTPTPVPLTTTDTAPGAHASLGDTAFAPGP